MSQDVRETHRAGEPQPLNPPPRYDGVFFEGLRNMNAGEDWVDKLPQPTEPTAVKGLSLAMERLTNEVALHRSMSTETELQLFADDIETVVAALHQEQQQVEHWETAFTKLGKASQIEIKRLQQQLRDYEEVLADHRRLVRELDILLNGENAAKQASLVDLFPQIERLQQQVADLQSLSDGRGRSLEFLADALHPTEKHEETKGGWCVCGHYHEQLWWSVFQLRAEIEAVKAERDILKHGQLIDIGTIHDLEARVAELETVLHRVKREIRQKLYSGAIETIEVALGEATLEKNAQS